MRNIGFTLQEILIVLVIVGILVALALPNYTRMKDEALNKVARSTLALVRAGEQIYRMEYGSFAAADATSNVNTILKLTIPTGADSRWEYKVVPVVGTPITNAFTGKAQRTDAGATKVWCISQASEEAYDAGCAW